MAERFRFKQALLQAPVEVAVTDTAVETADWRVELAKVTAAGMVNHTLRGQRMIRLDLVAGDETRRLGINLANRGWKADPDAQAFLGCAARILRALEAAQPTLRVTYGEHGRARWAMFLVGLVSALAGVAIFVLALATGVSGDRLVAGAVPMLLLVVFGGFVMLTYAPWASLPQMPPGAMAKALDALREGRVAD